MSDGLIKGGMLIGLIALTMVVVWLFGGWGLYAMFLAACAFIAIMERNLLYAGLGIAAVVLPGLYWLLASIKPFPVPAA